MAAQCCTTRIVKIWDPSDFGNEIGVKCAPTVLSHIMPTLVFQLHYVADIVGSECYCFG